MFFEELIPGYYLVFGRAFAAAVSFWLGNRLGGNQVKIIIGVLDTLAASGLIKYDVLDDGRIKIKKVKENE